MADFIGEIELDTFEVDVQKGVYRKPSTPMMLV